MMETPSLQELITAFKKNFPSLVCYLWADQEHQVDVRFAAKKIVQNRHQQKISYRLTLLDQDYRCLQQSFNQLDGEKHFLSLVQGLLPELSRQKPLDYRPALLKESLYQSQQTQQTTPFHLSSLFDYLKTHFEQSEYHRWDQHAGIVSYHKRESSLVTSQGGQVAFEQQYYHWDSSAFLRQYEITEKHLLSSLQELPPEQIHQSFYRFLHLPHEDHTSHLPTQRPKIILAAKALSQLLDYFIYTDHFNAQSLRKETSLFINDWKEKKQIFHSQFHLIDDPKFPGKKFKTPVDGLGNSRQYFPLILQGKIDHFLSTVREYSHHPTLYPQGYTSGHSENFQEYRPVVYDLVLPPPPSYKHKHLDELFHDMDQGYYLHDLHYLSFGDPQKLTLYGLTRGGFVFVNNGKPQALVHNMRFEVSLFELFKDIEQFGLMEEHLNWEGSVYCPSLLTKGFHFTQGAASI